MKFERVDTEVELCTKFERVDTEVELYAKSFH